MIEPFKHSDFRKHQEEWLDLPQATEDNYLHKRKRRSISIDLRPHLIYKATPQFFEDPVAKKNLVNLSPDPDSYINNTEWVDINRECFLSLH